MKKRKSLLPLLSLNLFFFSLALAINSAEAFENVLLSSQTSSTDINLPHHAIAVDGAGYIYLAGSVSSDSETTRDAYDTTYNGGNNDLFVAKYSPQGGKPLSFTLLGGSGQEHCGAMALDNAGNIVLTGRTTSASFAASQENTPTFRTEETAFVARLDASLANLQEILFLGPGEGTALITGADEDLYLAGQTDSLTFPITGGYDTVAKGGSDVFVLRLDSLLQITNATLLGGKGWEIPRGLAFGPDKSLFVAGFTDSKDFPVTKNSLQKTLPNRSGNGFIARFDQNLEKLTACSLLGGNDHDVIHAIALDRQGDLYLTGFTLSSDFPTMESSFDNTFNGKADGFVVKLNGDLTKLLAASFLGGSARDWSFSVIPSDHDTVYLAGDSDSEDFLLGARNDMTRKSNIFALSMNAELTNIKSAALLGLEGDERLPSMAYYDQDTLYIAGLTNSAFFPLPVNEILKKRKAETFDLFITRAYPQATILKNSVSYSKSLNCGKCHGTPPGSDYSNGIFSPGAHLAHLEFVCGECHLEGGEKEHINGFISIDLRSGYDLGPMVPWPGSGSGSCGSSVSRPLPVGCHDNMKEMNCRWLPGKACKPLDTP